MMPVRLLVADHHAIHPAGRELYRALAETGRFTVRVVAPEIWNEMGVTMRCAVEDRAPVRDPGGEAAFSVTSSPLLFGGKTHRNIYLRLFREVRAFRPDILMVNSEPEGFLAFQAALMCSRVPRRPALVFTTWRNMPYGRDGEPFPVRWTWLCRLIESSVLPRAAWGIGLSPSAPEIFEQRGYPRVSYIPPWVDETRFSGVRRESGGTLAIGYVGRLVREKGVDLLLKALACVEWPFTLSVTGNGPELPSLRAMAEALGIADRCTFRAAVPAHEVPMIMHALDVLVLPSRSRPGWKEQFGRVLIEAMASGTIVVGSDNGDIPAVIGDAGLIFREEHVEGLREALNVLSRGHDLREDFRARGRARVASTHALSSAVHLHTGVLLRLFAERFSPGSSGDTM